MKNIVDFIIIMKRSNAILKYLRAGQHNLKNQWTNSYNLRSVDLLNMISSPDFAQAFSKHFNPIQPSVAFHIETSHLICGVNQTTGFHLKCNTGLKWSSNACSSMVKGFQISGFPLVGGRRGTGGAPTHYPKNWLVPPHVPPCCFAPKMLIL